MVDQGGAAQHDRGAPSLPALDAGPGAYRPLRDALALAGRVPERYGRWGKAIEVPGLGALNKGQGAEVNSVSCGSAGNCAAVGDYTDRRGNGQGFVAGERNGRWG